MLQVIINKLSYCPYSLKKITKMAKAASEEERDLKGVVEINIVNPAEIKKLNRLYRGQNKITDVLSFAWKEDLVVESEFLGQIYICYDKVAEQAKDFKVPTAEEFVRILVHGLLHLVGYDHAYQKEAARMFALQEKIVAKLRN